MDPDRYIIAEHRDTEWRCLKCKQKQDEDEVKYRPSDSDEGVCMECLVKMILAGFDALAEEGEE